MSVQKGAGYGVGNFRSSTKALFKPRVGRGLCLSPVAGTIGADALVKKGNGYIRLAC